MLSTCSFSAEGFDKNHRLFSFVI